MADASAAPGPTAPVSRTPPRRRDIGTHMLAAGLSFLATLIGVLLLAWLVLFVTKGRFLKHTFERVASAHTGRTVKVAGDFNLYFDPFATKFLAEGLTISNPAWASKPDLFRAKLIDMRIATFTFLFGNQSKVNWINLVDGAADMEWNARHDQNTWTFGQTRGKPFQMPLIQRAQIDGTTARYRDPRLQLSVDVAFQAIEAKDSRFARIIRFTGDGFMRRHPFHLWGSQSSPNELLASGENRFEMHADGALSHVDVAGTLQGATVIDGADLSVAARGRNIRDLFDLIGVAVPDTRTYRLKSHLVKQGGEYRFTRITGFYGASDLAGRFTARIPTDPTERIFLSADLRSRHVDIIDVGPFIGYDAKALAAQGATAAATTQHKRDGVPRILPDAPLRSDSIKLFDAKVTYRIDTIKQPFVPISNILLGLDLDRSLLKLSPLNFDLATGHLSSDIVINARNPAVVTDYDVRLSPTPIGKLLYKSGVAEGGTSGVLTARAKLHGTGNSLRASLASSNGRIAIILPKGSFWTQYIQLSEFDLGVFVQKLLQDKLKKPVQLNCGLIAFTVRDGYAAADPILIDTEKNVMTAKGGFSFKDEALSMAFRADGKKFSLFSGQSPVGIGGHFAAPKMQIITPQLLTRGGAGLALGIVASPLAAILAFVDPGDAKSAACGPVLAGAHAAAQRTTKGEPRKDVGTGTTRDIKAQKEKG
ncbi:MAG TPA: AsmA family protein [Sphingomonas sp.]|nr:AsmA family protein [Sphingomonas sp.]